MARRSGESTPSDPLACDRTRVVLVPSYKGLTVTFNVVDACCMHASVPLMHSWNVASSVWIVDLWMQQLATDCWGCRTLLEPCIVSRPARRALLS